MKTVMAMDVTTELENTKLTKQGAAEFVLDHQDKLG
jgi:hypothetical protein